MLTELRTLIARHAPGRSLTPLSGLPDAMSAMRLVANDGPTQSMSSIYDPVFAVVAQGVKRTVLGEQIYEYGAGDYLVVSVELPVTGRVVRATPQHPFLAFGLMLDPVAIAGLLLETAATGSGALAPAGIGISPLDADLLDPVVRLLRLIDRPQDIAVLAPMLEREILWRLLNGAQGHMVRQIGLADSRLTQVGRAIRWIRAHYAEQLRIEEVAGIAAMSTSSLHRHFRAVTAMSPLQYQKQVRLQQARTLMLADAESAATVAQAVGYDSASQFSREYSRLFGAPPARDAARLRAIPARERSIA